MLLGFTYNYHISGMNRAKKLVFFFLEQSSQNSQNVPSSFSFFSLFMTVSVAYGISGLMVKSELKLQAYTTAVAT